MDFSPVATAVNLGFSVADGESPTVQLNGQVLTMKFIDWQERLVTAIFTDTIGVRWQEAEHYYDGDDPYDGCSVIENSTWLAEHVRQGCAFGEGRFRHLKLNFNAAGVVEVLCTAVEVEQ